MATPSPDAFFAALADRALAGASSAPTLDGIVPLVDRGWRLRFRLAGGREDLVEINAIVRPPPRIGLAFSYLPPRLASAPHEQHLGRVGQLLCRALERAAAGRLPPALTAPQDDGRAAATPRESIVLRLDGSCDRGCIFCTVSLHPKPPASGDDVVRLPRAHPNENFDRRLSTRDLEAKLRAGAHRADEILLEWSGQDCLASPSFDVGLKLAHELGYRNMGLQTPGTRLLEPGFIDHLRACSVDRVSLTAHAGDEATFDLVGGKQGAYRLFWRGLEALLAAGVRVALQVPILAETVDGLPEHLVHLSTFPVRLTCFLWYPNEELEGTVARFGLTFTQVMEALERARDELPARRVMIDGVPECVVPPTLLDHYRWCYGTGHTRPLRFERVSACADCAARDRCPGAVAAYLDQYPWPGTPVPATEPRRSPGLPGAEGRPS